MNALLPVTIDAPAMSGMIARDTSVMAKKILGPVAGNNEDITRFFNELGTLSPSGPGHRA